MRASLLNQTFPKKDLCDILGHVLVCVVCVCVCKHMKKTEGVGGFMQEELDLNYVASIRVSANIHSVRK